MKFGQPIFIFFFPNKNLFLQENWPLTLKTFFTHLDELRPNIYTDLFHPNNQNTKISGVNPKKLHEINKLSLEIHNLLSTVSATTENTILIDLGSGLGYLSEFINQKYGYKVLGLEADAERVQTASNRQRKLFPHSINHVHFVQHFINDIESIAFIENELDHRFSINSKTRYALIGLHACADLTIVALRLYLFMQNVTTIAIMPCCYHKMNYCTGDKKCTTFQNIPLSRVMQTAPDSLELWASIINRPFLRLASQQTAARWKCMSEEEHNKHGQNMFQRALLESILDEGSFFKFFFFRTASKYFLNIKVRV